MKTQRPRPSDHLATPAHRALVAALFGAAMTVITLTGAVTIAETPRQLAAIAQSLGSTMALEVRAGSYEASTEAVAPPVRTHGGSSPRKPDKDQA